MDYFAGDDRSNYQRMVDGDFYVADDPRIGEAVARAADGIHRYTELSRTDPAAARDVLAGVLGSLGEESHIRPPFVVDLGFNIHLGARTFVNYNLVALDVAPIWLGDDVLVGPNVQLLTPVHPLQPTPRRDKLEGALPITIEDNVWLGGGVIVCPGVTIGRDTVVGAGSVVTRDLPAGVLAVGNPARVVRELTDDDFDARRPRKGADGARNTAGSEGVDLA
ncbi:sugar O-acetyltransferase [Sanguibacter sp. HDW7]|uniref:sugar O-acetyltransferase n=1 Tax=Sanguibacter sp. HDW7 TaxID=2714931 RepID=UPI001409761A|nr:sugar O-acetyltransferase [Sanguibacter sp. HDW7]QIK83754.1 sugar O-acetyltransferase [Sanguibacter sp. HDW7]